jgi:hypothetical protein
MSTAMAIAAVTAALKSVLAKKITDLANLTNLVGQFEGPLVFSQSPHSIAEKKPYLNFFMYMANESAAMRNLELPTRDAAGRRLSKSPLALELNYVLTARAPAEVGTDVLLGHGMQAFHEMPILSKAQIVSLLRAQNIPEIIKSSGIENQMEEIKIIHKNMSLDEMSKLWSTFQSPYHASSCYKVTVILIETDEPVISSLPVLTRGKDDTGPIVGGNMTAPVGVLPEIFHLHVEGGQKNVLLGGKITLEGSNLNGEVVKIVFTHPHLSSPIELNPDRGNSANKLTVTIPKNPKKWAAGFYRVSVRVTPKVDKKEVFQSNAVSVGLAPSVKKIDRNQITRKDKKVTFKDVELTPDIHPGQSASLIIGSESLNLDTKGTASTSKLTFSGDLHRSGSLFFRLRVDGVDSPLIDHTEKLPKFITTQKVVVP